MNQSKILVSFLLFISFACSCLCQSTWEELSDLTFTGIERVFSFEIDGILYVGGGRINDGVTVSSMWAYDINDDSWTFRSDFPGPSTRNAFAFSIGGIGYMGTGYNGSFQQSQFWKYDPVGDDWTELPDFPGGARSHAIAFSSDTKAYVMAGGDSNEPIYYNDLWEFDPLSESWTLLSNFPGDTRWRPYGWFINEKIYIGGGSKSDMSFEDLYAYDLASGTWEEKTACPTNKVIGGFFFTLHNKGYFIEGASEIGLDLGEYGNQVFEYDPSLNSWTRENAFIGPPRVFGFSATHEDKVILGLGRNYEDNIRYKDIYSFTDDLTPVIDLDEDLKFTIYPNPSTSVLNIKGEFEQADNVICNILDSKGSLVLSIEKVISTQEQTIKNLDISQLGKGLYQLEIIYDNILVVKRFVKI